MNVEYLLDRIPFQIRIISKSAVERHKVLLQCLHTVRRYFPYGWLFADTPGEWYGYMPRESVLNADFDKEWFATIVERQKDRVGRYDINENIFFAFVDRECPAEVEAARHSMSISTFITAAELDKHAPNDDAIVLEEVCKDKWTLRHGDEEVALEKEDTPLKLFHMLCRTAWGDEKRAGSYPVKRRRKRAWTSLASMIHADKIGFGDNLSN